MLRLSGLARRLDEAIGALSGTILFVMMALTAVDVVGRYAFNRPFRGSLELTEILMTVMIFAGLPVVTSKGGHVTVDIADALIPSAVKRWLGFIVNLACAVALAALAWRLAVKALQLGSYGDTTAALLLPLWPLAWFMTLGTALTTVAMTARAVASPPWGQAATDAQTQAQLETGAL